MTQYPAPKKLIERLARHLATRPDADWSACIEEAASLLAIMKDPDSAMREAGDEKTWRAMIDAALTERWSIDASLAPATTPPLAGSDEEGEIALAPEHIGQGAQKSAAWVHVKNTEGE